MFELAHIGIWDLLKTDEKKCLITNNSAAHFPTALKFGRLVLYEIS